MKFLADMGISPVTVRFLRDLGHDAIHLHDENLDRMADPEIVDKARRESRALLTHDLGFGELIATSVAGTPTVVTFRLRDMRPDNVNRYLRAVLERHLDAMSQGALISVAENRIRVRRLPLG